VLKTKALQNAILHSANFSIIATDLTGVIQLFNVGAERMLGYRADTSSTNSIRAICMSPRKSLRARSH
jgi:PAS domain S-box-containing protein